MSDRTFWLVTFGIGLTGAVIFVAGFLFCYFLADFTMSDAQAKAYCSQNKPSIIINVDGAAEDDIWIEPQDEAIVDII